MALTKLRPEKTLAELLVNPTEDNLHPLTIYRIITDWAEVVAESAELIVKSLESAQQYRRSPSPEEKQRLITLVKRVLTDFHRDLASLFQNYRHKWRPRYVADAAEIQAHIQACLDALDPDAHLRLNANLIYHAVGQNTLNLVHKQIKQITGYSPGSTSLILRFEQSQAVARSKIDELEDEFLQLVGI